MNLALAPAIGIAIVKGKPQALALGLVNYDCEDVHKTLLSSSTVNAIITLVYFTGMYTSIHQLIRH